MISYIIFYLAGFVTVGALVLCIIRSGRDPESDRVCDEEQAQYLRGSSDGC